MTSRLYFVYYNKSPKKRTPHKGSIDIIYLPVIFSVIGWLYLKTIKMVSIDIYLNYSEWLISKNENRLVSTPIVSIKEKKEERKTERKKEKSKSLCTSPVYLAL